MSDVARRLRVGVPLQQLRDDRLHLAKRLAGDAGEEQCPQSWWGTGIDATSTSEAAGYWPSWGSTGPSAVCGRQRGDATADKC